jgi:hypothetical protein
MMSDRAADDSTELSDHVGFSVDGSVASGQQARAIGAAWTMGDPNNKGEYEVKHTARMA